MGGGEERNQKVEGSNEKQRHENMEEKITKWK